MSEELEILVHVSAPQIKRNDDLYRALTDAYLDFEPQQSHLMVDLQKETVNHRTNLAEEPPATTEGQSGKPEFNASESNDSYGSFPSHLISGDQPNHHEDSLAQDNSSSEEPATNDTPSRLYQLERLQAKWREQRALKPNDANRLRSKTLLSSSPEKSMFIDDTQMAFQVVESQLLDRCSATSEDSPLEDDMEPGPAYTYLLFEAGNGKDGSHVNYKPNKTPSCNVSLSVANDQVPPTSRLPRCPALSSDTSIQNEAGIRDEGPPTQTLDYNNLPLEVYPPPPRISVEVLETWPSQVNKFLEMIKQQNPRRFKPSKYLRVLEQNERGYWLVDCQLWAHNIQQDFWISLSDHICTGRLGWGITLHREAINPRNLGRIQLFCWGEIIEHIWLCLWICSKGKIYGSSSKWIDAEDSVVVEVP